MSALYPMINGWGLTETFCNLSISYGNAIEISWNSSPAPGIYVEIAEDGELIAKLTNHPIVSSLVKKAVANANVSLSDYEKIKKYTILPRKLTQSRADAHIKNQK